MTNGLDEIIAQVPAYQYARAVGLLAVLPLLGKWQKGGVALVAALWAHALCGEGAPIAALSPWTLLQECILGAVLGVPTALLVRLARLYGAVIDTVRGTTLGSILDPHMQPNPEGTAASGLLLEGHLVGALLMLGGAEVLAESYLVSFHWLAAGVGVGSLADVGSLSLLWGGQLLAVGATFLVPILVLSVLADFLSVAIAKIAPGLTLTSEVAVLRSGLVLLFVLAVSSRFPAEKLLPLLSPSALFTQISAAAVLPNG